MDTVLAAPRPLAQPQLCRAAATLPCPQRVGVEGILAQALTCSPTSAAALLGGSVRLIHLHSTPASFLQTAGGKRW